MNSMADLAVSIGPDVPLGRFPVEIHSIFRSAINLQPTWGGNLITLLSHEAPDCPQGIRLFSTQDFTTTGLAPRGTGRFQVEGVTLDRGTVPFYISFAKAHRLPVRPLPFIQHLGDNWQAGIDLLSQLQVQANTDLRIRTLVDHDSAHGCLGQRLTRAALALGESVRARALPSAGIALSQLVGLGSGLTPTGDDFLCGFITAAHCRLREQPEQTAFFRALKPTLLAWLAKTNAISATFLRCAVEGHVCPALHDLAETHQGGSPFRNALAELCAFGHSSGMDITTGFLFGLTVWE
jgi:hypothetical protein